MASAHASCRLRCLCSQQAPIFLQILPLWAFSPILGLPVAVSHCLLSPLAEYTLFLTRSAQPLVSPSSGLFPFAQCCVYRHSGQAAGFCISDIVRPAQSQSRLQEAPWAPFVECLDWGIIFLNKPYCHLTSLPLCSATPSPLRHPSPSCCLLLQSCPFLCCGCHLSLILIVIPPLTATISLTLGCTGKTCDLQFTPNKAGTAFLGSLPGQMQLPDSTAPGKQPCCPLNDKEPVSSGV